MLIHCCDNVPLHPIVFVLTQSRNLFITTDWFWTSCCKEVGYCIAKEGLHERMTSKGGAANCLAAKKFLLAMRSRHGYSCVRFRKECGEKTRSSLNALISLVGHLPLLQVPQPSRPSQKAPSRFNENQVQRRGSTAHSTN